MSKSKYRDGAILTHALKLQRLFPATKTWGPIELYKRLHRIEAEAHTLAERQCNENLPDGYVEKKDASILRRLDEILGFKSAGVPVFVNGDPRGYALKIDDKFMRKLDREDQFSMDWGGYGILAPEF